MKFQQIKIGGFLCAILFSLSGCKDTLDVDRIGAITPENMWSNPDFIKYYVNDFYKILPAWNQMSDLTEEAASKTLSSVLRGINASSDDYPGREWPYASLRSINVFLQNIESSNAGLTAEEKAYMTGQAHFFRAMLYFKMVKVMGGVPIITDVLNPTDDLETLQKSRNSTKECFDFIVSELDQAIVSLPVKGTASYENSRINKAAAMAYKGEVLLWKASPLFCKVKNNNYWEDAYKALNDAKVELDKEGYGLYRTNAANTMDNYWYDKPGAATENIIFVEYKYPAKSNGHQQSQRPLSTSSGSAGGNEPTWELVKAFPMKNGKAIQDPSSGYQATMFWKNRDPRFYTTIVYNGATYGIGNDKTRHQWIFNSVNEDGYLGNGYNNSGFYSRKAIDTTLNQTVWSQQAFDWPVLRYTEVLMNLAEAANELDSKRGTVLSLLTPIRDRVGIVAGTDGRFGFGEDVGANYASTLKAIMGERLIEFAYEGKRFMDLRRRRMFAELDSYGTFHAYGPYLDKAAAVALKIGITADMSTSDIMKQLNIYLSSPNAKADEVLKTIFQFKQDKIDVNPDAKIAVPERNYFAPLKQDWIKKNPKLKQNTGWDNGDFNPVIQ